MAGDVDMTLATRKPHTQPHTQAPHPSPHLIHCIDDVCEFFLHIADATHALQHTLGLVNLSTLRQRVGAVWVRMQRKPVIM